MQKTPRSLELEKFARLFRAARKEAGFARQKDLRKALKDTKDHTITANTLSSIETGQRKPRQDTFSACVELFEEGGVSAGTLTNLQTAYEAIPWYHTSNTTPPQAQPAELHEQPHSRHMLTWRERLQERQRRFMNRRRRYLRAIRKPNRPVWMWRSGSPREELKRLGWVMSDFSQMLGLVVWPHSAHEVHLTLVKGPRTALEEKLMLVQLRYFHLRDILYPHDPPELLEVLGLYPEEDVEEAAEGEAEDEATLDERRFFSIQEDPPVAISTRGEVDQGAICPPVQPHALPDVSRPRAALTAPVAPLLLPAPQMKPQGADEKQSTTTPRQLLPTGSAEQAVSTPVHVRNDTQIIRIPVIVSTASGQARAGRVGAGNPLFSKAEWRALYGDRPAFKNPSEEMDLLSWVMAAALIADLAYLVASIVFRW